MDSLGLLLEKLWMVRHFFKVTLCYFTSSSHAFDSNKMQVLSMEFVPSLIGATLKWL